MAFGSPCSIELLQYYLHSNCGILLGHIHPSNVSAINIVIFSMVKEWKFFCILTKGPDHYGAIVDCALNAFIQRPHEQANPFAIQPALNITHRWIAYETMGNCFQYHHAHIVMNISDISFESVNSVTISSQWYAQYKGNMSFPMIIEWSSDSYKADLTGSKHLWYSLTEAHRC